jgi:hypothetical protein
MLEFVRFDLTFYLEDKMGNQYEFKLHGCKDIHVFTKEAQERINEMIAIDLIGGE